MVGTRLRMKRISVTGPGVEKDATRGRLVAESSTPAVRRQETRQETSENRNPQRSHRRTFSEASLEQVRLAFADMPPPLPEVVEFSNSSTQSVSSSEGDDDHNDHHDDDAFDELHSDRYTFMLDKLQLLILRNIPCITEDMVSSAIIDAFAWTGSTECDNNDNKGGGDVAVEARHLWKTSKWLRARSNRTFSERQSFLRGRLIEVLVEIRDQKYTQVEDALAVLVRAALLLRLDVETRRLRIPQNGVILSNLPTTWTDQDVREALALYGQVQRCSLSQGWGYFQFSNECSQSGLTNMLRKTELAQVKALVIPGTTGRSS